MTTVRRLKIYRQHKSPWRHKALSQGIMSVFSSIPFGIDVLISPEERPSEEKSSIYGYFDGEAFDSTENSVCDALNSDREFVERDFNAVASDFRRAYERELEKEKVPQLSHGR